MVIEVSWFVATFIALLYIRFWTRDLDIIADKFKVEILRVALALMIMRGVLYTAKNIFELWQ